MINRAVNFPFNFVHPLAANYVLASWCRYQMLGLIVDQGGVLFIRG
jgi:hypothetical protein